MCPAPLLLSPDPEHKHKADAICWSGAPRADGMLVAATAAAAAASCVRLRFCYRQILSTPWSTPHKADALCRGDAGRPLHYEPTLRPGPGHRHTGSFKVARNTKHKHDDGQ